MATTLLAIDDSVTMRKVLELTFAGEDFRVVTADSSDAALTKLRSERPSIVLCDVSLEGAGGYGLCAQIKAESPSAQVLLLASKQQPYDSQKGQKSRADDYIEKPFDTQQLIEKVKRLATRPIAPEPPAPARAPIAAAPTQPGIPPAQVPIAARSGGTAPMPVAIARPPLAGQATGPRTSPGVPAIAPQAGRGTLSYGGAGDIPSTREAPRPPAGAAVARPPAAPAAAPPQAAAAPTPVSSRAVSASVSTATNGQLAAKLADLGLTEAQVSGVLALSREVVEKVVWEVVPVLAETMIKEEIKRLTSE